MEQKRRSSNKSFTYEEFQKKFLTVNEKSQRSNKGALYELGAKMARESLSECKKEE